LTQRAEHIARTNRKMQKRLELVALKGVVPSKSDCCIYFGFRAEKDRTRKLFREKGGWNNFSNAESLWEKRKILFKILKAPIFGPLRDEFISPAKWGKTMMTLRGIPVRKKKVAFDGVRCTLESFAYGYWVVVVKFVGLVGWSVWDRGRRRGCCE